jgi:hypothetical protein
MRSFKTVPIVRYNYSDEVKGDEMYRTCSMNE